MKKLFIFLISLGLLLFSACTSEANQFVSSNASRVKPASESAAKQIYSDKLIAASFVKKYDAPGIKGMFYFDLKVENKSNKKLTVYLQDVSVNDTMVAIGSGVPLTLLPTKSEVHSFFGKYEGTGITSENEIKKIGFKIQAMDESSSTIETTKAIEIKF